MTTVVVLQPGYLPWLGFFDQLRRCDFFVYYDDVQFDKHGWRNRNRIKSASGPIWLTVPVLSKGRSTQTLLDVEVDNRTHWARKHVASIAQSYARSPHKRLYMPKLEELLMQSWTRLVDLDIQVVKLMCEWLGLRRPIARSSQLGIHGGQSERLVQICSHFGADRYLSGDSAKDYLDESMFVRAGISVVWHGYEHPVYRQLHGDFCPYLSGLDLLLNMGPESTAVLEGSR